jgi:lipid-A-disaccharide synthase
MKIFLICGEKSGDNLINQILDKINKDNDVFNNIELAGIVSDETAKKFNIKQFFNPKELAILGIGDIIFNIPKIIDRITDTVNEINNFKPDLIITIDAYDFCIRVAKKIRKTNKTVQIWQIVAPSVWAYWEFRAKILSKYYNRLFYLLPMERNYFKPLEKNNYKNSNNFSSTFIGYPASFQEKNTKITKNNKLIGITIGSRKSEVKRHKKLIASVIMKLKIFDNNLNFAIFTTENTEKDIKKLLSDFKNINFFNKKEDKQKIIQECILVIAKNGTNNVEIGALGAPMIIYYKTSILTYLFAKCFAKIKSINLFNIVLNKKIIPEFLQNQATADNLVNEAIRFINDENLRQKQIEEINNAIFLMQRKDKKHPIDIVSEEIVKYLNTL